MTLEGGPGGCTISCVDYERVHGQEESQQCSCTAQSSQLGSAAIEDLYLGRIERAVVLELSQQRAESVAYDLTPNELACIVDWLCTQNSDALALKPPSPGKHLKNRMRKTGKAERESERRRRENEEGCIGREDELCDV